MYKDIQKKIDLISQNFFYNSKVLQVNSIDSGLINKTYLVKVLYNRKKFKYILQCLSNIFQSHELVNMNHKLVTDHIKKKVKESHLNFNKQRWEVPSLISCNSSKVFLLSFDSHFWRAMFYIDDTFTLDILEDITLAHQVGIGLAKFHKNCSDLNYKKLNNSIKNFHNTNYYINRYNIILKDYNFTKLEKNIKMRVENLIFNLSNHIDYVNYIVGYLEEKSIELSVIHGDPKLSNFLFDNQYKYVVSLVDLDTVSSGYLLTDLADCLRSICNIAGEDPNNKDNVSFDIKCCEYFLKGYFSIQIKNDQNCFELIPEYIYLIIVELTIRFLNDFLQSEEYFRINYQTQNLYRAEVQFQLLSSFVSQAPILLNSLHDIGISSNPTFISDVQKIV